MSAHKLTIAKASLTAAFLRPGAIPTSKDELAELHRSLDSVLKRCSRQDIQTCKQWLLRFCIPSQPRVEALAKYLTALSESMSVEKKDSSAAISARKERLHLLYLVHDLLYHLQHRGPLSEMQVEALLSSWQPMVDSVFHATLSNPSRPKHQKRLDDLLRLWETSHYFERPFLSALRRDLDDARGVLDTDIKPLTKASNDEPAKPNRTVHIPYMLPETHGDFGTPYFDLPAANILPHITPNSMKPINPAMVQPLKFRAGPANEDLVGAVGDLLRSVRHVYGESLPGEKLEMDSGKEQDGYYGWSLDFCRKMKERKEKNRQEMSNRSRSSSPGRRKRPRFGMGQPRESSYDSY